MNRFPTWKYALIAVAIVAAFLYTLPNFFGEAPAVQVSSGKATIKVDASLVPRVEQALTQAGVNADFVQLEGTSVRARFADTDTQIKARDAVDKALNPDPNDRSYIVALNLLSRSPQWLTSLHALPMYLGLDLRGGVHFLMQVDMSTALTKKAETIAGDVRSMLRDKNIRHAGISRERERVEIRFRDTATLEEARGLLVDRLPEMQWTPTEGAEPRLVGTLTPQAQRAVQEAEPIALASSAASAPTDVDGALPRTGVGVGGATSSIANRPGSRTPLKSPPRIAKTAATASKIANSQNFAGPDMEILLRSADPILSHGTGVHGGPAPQPRSSNSARVNP